MKGVVGFCVCTFSGQQTEHWLYAVAPLHTPGGAAFGAGRDLWIVLAICGHAHDVKPIEIPKLWQMIAVKTGVVGEDGGNTVGYKPMP